MPLHGLDPSRIPAGFWHRAEVQDALDRFDVRALFLLVRQHTGASQTQIGMTVGMPQSQVSLIMSTGRRQRRVTAHGVLIRIAAGLDMPDDARARLGLAPGARHPDRTRADVSASEDDPEPWSLAEALTRSSVSPQIVDRLERLTLAQVARYPSTPPAEMWPVVQREMSRVKGALSNRQTLNIQRRLVTVAGVLAGVAGNLSIDSGQPSKAYEYFDLGRVAGEEAADDDLVAWSLALQSIDPFFRGNSRKSAALLDEAGKAAAAGSTARRRAWIDAMRARAHGAAGDRGTALQALDRATIAMREAQPATDTDFFDQDRLSGMAGTTYLLLSDTERAFGLITQAIERRPYADAKGRALLTLDKAACRVIEREPDNAAQLVHEALDLADGQLVRPIAIRAREVRARMSGWQGTESLKTLDERLKTLPA